MKYNFFSESDHFDSKKAVVDFINDLLDKAERASKNVGSYVSYKMDQEVFDIIKESVHINLVNRAAYPKIVQIEEESVEILGKLLGGKNVVGVSTIGSSEAIMLAGLAQKYKWEENFSSESRSKPNIIMGNNVHVAWKKFCQHYDIEPRYVESENIELILNLEKALKLVDNNTIGIVTVLGNTYNGGFDDIFKLNKMLSDFNKKDGHFIPIHVDAAIGGFVSPFNNPKLLWDFRLEHVVSINLSSHKFGLIYPSLGWALWKNRDYISNKMSHNSEYLGLKVDDINLNFSRPAIYLLMQYYNFLLLGYKGYKKVMNSLFNLSDYWAGELKKIKYLKVHYNKTTLPFITISSDTYNKINLFKVARLMQSKEWILPTYSLPSKLEDQVISRIIIRTHMNKEYIDEFMTDLQEILENFE